MILRQLQIVLGARRLVAGRHAAIHPIRRFQEARAAAASSARQYFGDMQTSIARLETEVGGDQHVARRRRESGGRRPAARNSNASLRLMRFEAQVQMLVHLDTTPWRPAWRRLSTLRVLMLLPKRLPMKRGPSPTVNASPCTWSRHWPSYAACSGKTGPLRQAYSNSVCARRSASTRPTRAVAG